MLALLNQFSTLTLAIGGFVLFAVNVVFCKWFLGKMQSEPVDEPDDEEEEEVVGAPAGLTTEPAFRTSAGVPRSRPIQPVTAPASATPPTSATPGSPIRLASLVDLPVAKASDYAPIMESPAAKAGSPTDSEIAPASAPRDPSLPIDLLGSASKSGALTGAGLTSAASPTFSSTPAGPSTSTPAPGATGSPISLTRLPEGTPAPTASLTALTKEVSKAGEPAKAADSAKAEGGLILESSTKAIEAASPSSEMPVVGGGSPLFSSQEKSQAPASAAELPPILPPLNFTKRGSSIDRPAIAPLLGSARPASADLIMTPKIPTGSATSASAPAAKPTEVPAAPPLTPLAGNSPRPAADLISVDKPTAPLASVSADQKEALNEPSAGNPDALAKEMSILKPTESAVSERAQLIAIPPSASTGKPAETPGGSAEKAPEKATPAAEKTSAAEVPSEPGGAGLMLIPTSPASSPVAPPEETPAPISGTPAPTSWKTRLLGRPRIFLPTAPNAAAAPAATPEAAESAPSGKSDAVKDKADEPVLKEEPKSAGEPTSEKPASVEADIPTPTASLMEAKTPSTEKSGEAPVGSLVLSSGTGGLIKSATATAEPATTPDAPKPRNIFMAPESSAGSATVSLKAEDDAAKPVEAVPAAPIEDLAAENPSVNLAQTTEAGKSPGSTESLSADVASTDLVSPPVENKSASTESASAATTEPDEAKVPEQNADVIIEPKADSSSPEPVDSTTEAKPVEFSTPAEPAPAAEATPSLILPAASPAAPVTAGTPPEEAAAASQPPARSFEPVSARPVEPVMNQEKSNVAQPAGGRASAQITLGFEITSLQLTPFFKLGAVQLRSLSNVVSLHLIASQAAENPLAAGISFQIDTVDLDESSHIKSILLKPLGQSQALTAPQPKLQVENVKIGSGAEGAIEVTSSQQTSTAVQMLATCTIAAMDFTPSFEIGSLRLEPNSNSVMLRLAPSSRPAALDLPPSFEVATVQLEGNAQLANVRLVPSTAK